MSQSSLLDSANQPFSFDGPAYSPDHDQARLTGQILRVFECMKDAKWRTLAEIADITGDPHASISAQLRHLRKHRFGGHVVDKRRRGLAEHGLWEYRLVVRCAKCHGTGRVKASDVGVWTEPYEDYVDCEDCGGPGEPDPPLTVSPPAGWESPDAVV